MSDENTYLAKIAALEAELAGLRKQKPAEPEIPSNIKVALLRDPVGTLTKLGVLDPVGKAVLGAAMGKDAPQNLMLDARVGASSALYESMEAEIHSLRQTVESFANKARLGETKSALNKIVADKTKYPHLASALAADESIFETDITSHRGSADELAQALESRLAATAKALGIKTPPASHGNADDAKTTATSTQAKAQSTGTMAGDPPPLPYGQPGNGFSEAAQKALRDEIVRNVERGVYNTPATPPQ